MSRAEAGGGFWGFDPEAPLDLGGIGTDAFEDITARLADRSMPALTATLAQVRNCSHPVRLSGHSDTIDMATGEVIETLRSADQPLGALYKPCGNRRADICPACSRLYARDTFELISTGLHGGKGVPETVARNPLLFVTLTAPTFGSVHTVRERGPCRPRSKTRACPHGRALTCWTRHEPTDPDLGAPLCSDCYDTTSAAIWQWHAPELWRRFTIALRRAVSAALGIPDSRLTEYARLEYAKVAEFQTRGLVHFHALIRLDGPHGPGTPAPVAASVLHEAVREAAASVRVLAPPVDADDAARVLRFGVQVDVRTVREGIGAAEDITAEQVAAYLAKYATKSTNADPLAPRAHLAALAQTCRELARRHLAGCPHGCQHVAGDRHPKLCEDCAAKPYALLGKWAGMLGFRGHYSTKSRHYSVTLGALRRARRRYQRLTADARRRGTTLDTRDLEARLMAEEDDETTLVIGSWAYSGSGWPRAGDKALADAAAARAREYAQWKAQQAA